MNNQDRLIMTQADFERISTLIKSVRREIAEPLEEELGRAEIVTDKDLPSDVVTMNSHVIFKDVDSGKESSATLVYPQDSNVEENKISILASLGSALIGLRKGQVIQWPFPSGHTKTLQVISVSRQA